MPQPCYITTPIYYVNDRPHIGHCYTTLLADVAARAHRLMGEDVFFLTGTDEHAEKVSRAAVERGLEPMEWATRNADRFKAAFEFMGFSNDDFVRTTEERHTSRASAYIQKLVDSGDIELGDYEGWYDPSQEEYVTESTAKEHDFNSPVTGKPLEKRVEQNYFFRLDKYEGWLKERIENDTIRVLPTARKNEVLGRIRQGLQKVPVSRRIKEGDADWGVRMPNDPEHRIYVWIEALCNYLTIVDTDERRKYWPKPGGTPALRAGSGNEEAGNPARSAGVPENPARSAGVPENPARSAGVPKDPARSAGVPGITHLMAKDILWFHAVIWPCMLHALGEESPKTVYAHAYWISEGRKMSKSLGNFIEIDLLEAYAEKYSLDALRWFLTVQGPLGATDADFAHSRFVEVYNADLANGIGNAASRVGNMIVKYFDAVVPFCSETGFTTETTEGHGEEYLWDGIAAGLVDRAVSSCGDVRLDVALRAGIELSNKVDAFIAATRPFSIAKELDKGTHSEPGRGREDLNVILYQSAEALRIASLLLWPAMPSKMAELWRNWDCSPLNDPDDPDSGFKAPLSELATWAHPEWGLKAGGKVCKGEALFMRADVKEAAPGGDSK